MGSTDIGRLPALEVAVIGDGRGNERMRELQEDRPAPPEEHDRFPVDLARD
jgi:hypothetical protein